MSYFYVFFPTAKKFMKSDIKQRKNWSWNEEKKLRH